MKYDLKIAVFNFGVLLRGMGDKAMLKELVARYEKEGFKKCQACGIYSKNGYLCRKCFDERFPVLEEEYRIDYYKMNVEMYSRKFNLPISVAAIEINRQVSDFWDEFAIEYFKKEKKELQFTWFALGLLSGSVLVAASLLIP